MDDAMNYNIEQTSESVETSIREENAVQQGSVETGEEESTLNNNTQAPKRKKKNWSNNRCNKHCYCDDYCSCRLCRR